MGRTKRILAACCTVAVTAVLVGCNPSVVSINYQGTDAGDRLSMDPVVSPDGTKVAFVSLAGDLVPGMPPTVGSNIYVRDLAAGTTELVSVSNQGAPADHNSLGPVFSPDGTKIAFASRAGNLTPLGTPGDFQLYVRDLVAGTTELVSVNPTGTAAGNGSAGDPSFSPDGTTVAFSSTASNLGPIDTNATTDVYVRDLLAGTTTLVSHNAAGTEAGNRGATHPVFRSDGTGVGYTSSSTDLGPVDTNAAQDAYLTHLATGTTTLLSPNAAGTDSGNDPTDLMGFTPDGSRALLLSYATDLLPGPPDPPDLRHDYFLRDLTTGAVTRIPVSGSPFSRSAFRFSPDGSRLAFSTDGNGVGPVDTTVCHTNDLPPLPYDCHDVYLHDLTTGVSTLVSANSTGTNGGNGDSTFPHFSPDGSRLVFTSTASDLGPTDTNGRSDVYVTDLAAGDLTLVSTRQDGSDSAAGVSEDGQFGQDDRTVIFTSQANDLGPGPDTNGHTDIYLKVLPN